MHLPKDHHSSRADQGQRETILIKEVEYRNDQRVAKARNRKRNGKIP